MTEPGVTTPWWLPYAPLAVAAMVLLTMVLEVVQHRPFTWSLIAAFLINLGVGVLLVSQKRSGQGPWRP